MLKNPLRLFLLTCAMMAVAAPMGTLQLEIDDLLRFSKTKMTVKAGASVTLVLKNSGRIPSIKHNWVLLKPGTSVTRFGNLAMSAEATGHIPDQMADAVVAHTEPAAAGQTVTVSFTAPNEKGDYIYICSFPGRYSVSKGILTVE